MGQTFQHDEDIATLLEQVRRDYHERLGAELTITELLVSKHDKDDELHQTLVVNGRPVVAAISVTKLKHRVLGVADCVLLVDDFMWGELDQPSRRAALDGQLERLTVDPEKKDDHGRPVVKLRRGDVQLDGFVSVMRRHGMASLEAQAVKACRDDETGQYAWEFAGDAKKKRKRGAVPKADNVTQLAAE